MSTETITADIKASIEKNLPAQVGDVLQARLKKADEDAARVLVLQGEVKDIREKNTGHLATIENLRSELSKHAALAAREDAVTARERNAEIAELKVQLAAAQGNAGFAREVALGLVRNVEYRSSIYDNQSRSVPIIQPGNTYPSGTAQESSTVSRSETRGAA